MCAVDTGSRPLSKALNITITRPLHVSSRVYSQQLIHGLSIKWHSKLNKFWIGVYMICLQSIILFSLMSLILYECGITSRLKLRMLFQLSLYINHDLLTKLSSSVGGSKRQISGFISLIGLWFLLKLSKSTERLWREL